MIKTGFGFDIHRLEEEGSFPLAGVSIQGKKVIAHSDGDILLHALSNAILSELGKEDIGTYFPDNEAKTKDRNSKDILLFAIEERKKKHYHLNNVAVTILLEKPKLSPYKAQIKKSLCSLLQLEEENVSILANTREKLGPIGEEKACACLVSILREKEETR